SPAACSTTSVPRSTSVHSRNSGRWPGSSQPVGLTMRAMLTVSVPLLTRPTYSSMVFGGVPAASTRVGRVIRDGIPRRYRTGVWAGCPPGRRTGRNQYGWQEPARATQRAPGRHTGGRHDAGVATDGVAGGAGVRGGAGARTGPGRGAEQGGGRRGLPLRPARDGVARGDAAVPAAVHARPRDGRLGGGAGSRSDTAPARRGRD